MTLHACGRFPGTISGGLSNGHFPGREIRRVLLLRDPVTGQISLYNYRMMNYLAKGRGTYSFALHQRALPRDFVAHFLLSRWLEDAAAAYRRYRALDAVFSTRDEFLGADGVAKS